MVKTKTFKRYYNDEKMSFCDFIESIKEDLLKTISENREFIDYYHYVEDEDEDPYSYLDKYDNKFIKFEITYSNYYEEDYDIIYYGGRWIIFKSGINFDIDGMDVDNFVKSALNCSNEMLKDYVEGDNGPFSYCFDKYYDDCFEYFNCWGESYLKKQCNINNFDEKFFVKELDFIIYLNQEKINHKNKFYKDFHMELIERTWNSSRYLDWIVDIEELRDFKERWSNN